MKLNQSQMSNILLHFSPLHKLVENPRILFFAQANAANALTSYSLYFICI